jgi:hypothetical protein
VSLLGLIIFNWFVKGLEKRLRQKDIFRLWDLYVLSSVLYWGEFLALSMGSLFVNLSIIPLVYYW